MFTDAYVRSLKARDTRYEVTEKTRTGLRVRVTTTGRKVWVLVFRLHGRLYRKTYGAYPAISVAEAHAAVAQDRLLLDKKLNPVTLAKEARQQALLRVEKDPTVESLCRIYIERYAKPNKRTWREDERVLEKDVLPRWADLRLSTVTRAHVAALIDDLVARGAGVSANRTFAIVRRMFNFAVERGLLQFSPCQGLKKPVKERSRDVVLTDTEIGRFWHALDDSPISAPVRTALRMLLATGQRPGEVAGMRWSELDERQRWWTIPAERAKNQLEHRIPISPYVRRLLTEAGPRSDSDYVFRSRLGDRPIATSGLDNAMREYRSSLGFDENRRITPHDLRRTAASKMVQGGVTRQVVAKVLNHAESGVTAVYDRHSYDPEKRRALLMWQVRLRALLMNAVANPAQHERAQPIVDIAA